MRYRSQRACQLDNCKTDDGDSDWNAISPQVARRAGFFFKGAPKSAKAKNPRIGVHVYRRSRVLTLVVIRNSKSKEFIPALTWWRIWIVNFWFLLYKSSIWIVSYSYIRQGYGIKLIAPQNLEYAAAATICTRHNTLFCCCHVRRSNSQRRR